MLLLLRFPAVIVLSERRDSITACGGNRYRRAMFFAPLHMHFGDWFESGVFLLCILYEHCLFLLLFLRWVNLLYLAQMKAWHWDLVLLLKLLQITAEWFDVLWVCYLTLVLALILTLGCAGDASFLSTHDLLYFSLSPCRLFSLLLLAALVSQSRHSNLIRAKHALNIEEIQSTCSSSWYGSGWGVHVHIVLVTIVNLCRNRHVIVTSKFSWLRHVVELVIEDNRSGCLTPLAPIHLGPIIDCLRDDVLYSEVLAACYRLHQLSVTFVWIEIVEWLGFELLNRLLVH